MPHLILNQLMITCVVRLGWGWGFSKVVFPREAAVENGVFIGKTSES